MVKICKKCNEEKPLGDFTKNPSCTNGISHRCKSCSSKYMREYKEKNKERVSTVEYRSNLKTRFGLTEKDYENMLISQNHCCAICGTHQSELSKRLHVDHCHTTMKIRGLLCRECNKALGMFKDNPERFQKAIRYLL